MCRALASGPTEVQNLANDNAEGRLVSSHFNFKQHNRVHGSFTAQAEKRLLVWIAERMPRVINSDHLTLLGVLALLAAGVSYSYARFFPAALLVVIFFLVVNWFGDSLDGTLARVRKQQRPRYGFYVDHICDAFGTLFLVGGMALSGYMSAPIAAALLLVYFLLSIEVYLATYTLGEFKISYVGFGPTELRIIIAVGNLALFYGDGWVKVGQRHERLFDVGGAIAITCLLIVLGITTIRHTRELYQQEPLP
jgi:phosphatidylglycerophosphate synthase